MPDCYIMTTMSYLTPYISCIIELPISLHRWLTGFYSHQQALSPRVYERYLAPKELNYVVFTLDIKGLIVYNSNFK